MPIAYLTFFLFCLLALAAASFYAYVKKKKAEFFITKPLQEIRIFDSLFTLENEYHRFEENGLLEEYPHIDRYLKNTADFLDGFGGAFDFHQITIQESEKIKDLDQHQEKFCEELKNCPPEILELVEKKEQIAMEIIKLKYVRWRTNLKLYQLALKCKLTLCGLALHIFRPFEMQDKIMDYKQCADRIDCIMAFSQKLTCITC